MAKVRLGMTISIDGFVADRAGDSGMLYPDLAELRDTDYMRREIDEAGAVLMGRHTFDMANGDLTGYEFQAPIFVLTHGAPDMQIKGLNDKLSVTFATGGLESAVRQAKAAARDKCVVSMGGPDTARQLLNAGLVDELQVDIMPVLLKQGLRFFDQLAGEAIRLEKIRLLEEGARISIRYRVLK